MKKKVLAMLLITSMAVSIAACGSKPAQTEENPTDQPASVTEEEVVAKRGVISTRDFNPDEYVTIGDYSGVSIETNTYTFTEDDVMDEINETVDYFLEYTDTYTYTPTDKQMVETGDIVNMNYSGKKDGVAFDGGTAQGAHLEIGSNKFIPGFEDGLIGHSVGETFDLPLTFPENYGQADLAGQDVVFEITLNSIDTKERPPLDDTLIKAMDIGFQNFDDLKARIRKEIQANCDSRALSENRNAVWNKVYPLCEVTGAPQELIDEVLSGIEQSLEYYANYYKVTVDEFVEQYMGMTKDVYDGEMLVSAENTAKERMAIAAIAKKAGITLSDDEVKAEAEAQCLDLGYSTGEDLLTELGTGYFYDYVLANRVKDYLITQVSVTENEPVWMFLDEKIAESAEEAKKSISENTARLEELREEGEEITADDASEETTEEAETTEETAEDAEETAE